MRIRDKIKKPRRPVVAYEILPPREKRWNIEFICRDNKLSFISNSY